VSARFWAGVVCALGLYFYLSVRDLHCPGLGYDELMWANAALGNLDGSWISLAIGRWPVLLALSYIGAFKGYVYYPIIALFGPSPESVRLPMILFGCVGLLATFGVARRVLGNVGALLCTLLVALHPELVLRLRHDLGPAAPDFLLRMGALYFLVRYTEGWRTRDAVLFWLTSLLGVWHKLTFMWYLNASLFAFVLFCGRPWWRALRERKGRAPFGAGLVHLGLYGACVAWFGWVFFFFNVTGFGAMGSGYDASIPERLAHFGRSMVLAIQGTESILFFLDPYAPVGAGAFFIGSLLLVGVGVVGAAQRLWLALREGRDGEARALGIVYSCFVTITVQLALTGPADKPWHHLTMQPLLTLAWVDGVLTLARWARTALERTAPAVRRFVPSGVVAGLSVLAVAYLGQIHHHLGRVLCEPAMTQRSFSRTTQSTAIYGLIDYVSTVKRRFVLMDWGMRNQLLLFTREPARLLEYHPSGLTPGSPAAEHFAQHHLGADSQDVFVVHGPEATCFPGGLERVRELARSRGVELRKLHEVRDTGSVIYEMWEVAR
jgi:hypothetical protein